MRIIGHRGAKGRAPENTIEAMHHALDQGVDGVEFDVRITRDKAPIIVHDKTLRATHKINKKISALTLTELNELIPGHTIPTLSDVLDIFWGKTFLNIELKSRGSAAAVISLLSTRYIEHEDDWQQCLISSFKAGELKTARRLSPHAPLAMIHNENPYKFIFYHRSLKFNALVFHRHHINTFIMTIARRLGTPTYAYTVNRPKAAKIARSQKFDAIISDYPARVRRTLES